MEMREARFCARICQVLGQCAPKKSFFYIVSYFFKKVKRALP